MRTYDHGVVLALALGVLGTVGACGEDEERSKDSVCEAWGKKQARCVETADADESKTACLQNFHTYEYFGNACAEANLDWYECRTDLSCDDLTSGEEFCADEQARVDEFCVE